MQIDFREYQFDALFFIGKVVVRLEEVRRSFEPEGI